MNRYSLAARNGLYFIPGFLRNTRLSENLLKEADVNILSGVWIGNSQLQRTFYHELMAAAGKRPAETERF